MKEKTFRRVESVLGREIAGDTYLIPVRGKLADLQRIFVLNSVGEHIWHLLDDRMSLKQIAAAVVERFTVNEETARAEANDFLMQLLENGLVEEACSQT